ncbi:MAG: TSUP family transporter [Candidatus Micrarchaeota archaeon]
MDLLFYALIFAISIIAAFIDVIVGGSSLLIIPAFAVLGVPLATVIGTNRFYVTAFVLTGLLNYFHKKVSVDLKLIAGFLALRVMGAFVGSSMLLQVSAELVKTLVAVFMFAAMLAILILDRQKNSNQQASTSKPRHLSNAKLAFLALCMLLLGFYEGFVGGGAGTISRVLLILFFGFTMLEAAFAELIMSFSGSLVASIVFVFSGKVDYVLLAPMLAGGVIGAFFGSSFAVKKGEHWMRSLLFLVVFILILKMLFA